MKSFKVACVALNPKMGDVAANRDNIIKWMRKAAAADAKLVIFPEGILSGYSFRHIEKSALSLDAPEIADIGAEAASLRLVVSIGLLERFHEGIYVSQLCLGRGLFIPYRKCHLTETEKKLCVAGDVLGIQDLGFVRMGTQICYDSAFPRASETLVRKGAELLITPTGHAYDWKRGEKRDCAAAIRKRRCHVGKYWRACL